MPLIEFNNPFCAKGQWWRGNLHTHTTVSDGALSPEETARRYRALGYDFLALTDHLAISKPFDAPEGLLMVPGVEYHAMAGDPPRLWHFVSLGPKAPEKRGDASLAERPVDKRDRTAIEGSVPSFLPPAELYASVRETSAYYFVAHPYWSGLVEDDLLDVRDAPAMEVFNGVCERAISRGYSTSPWDYALVCGVRLNAVAVDDAHGEREIGCGWIRLRAEKLDIDSVYAALRAGHWYSSTGPEIHDVRLRGKTVSVRTSPARSITFLSRSPDGKRFAARDGARLESAEYDIKGTEIYVRVQVEDDAGRRAFTNPIYVRADEGGKP